MMCVILLLRKCWDFSEQDHTNIQYKDYQGSIGARPKLYRDNLKNSYVATGMTKVLLYLPCEET